MFCPTPHFMAAVTPSLASVPASGERALLRGRGRVDEGLHEHGHFGHRDVLQPSAGRVPAAVQLEPVHAVHVLQLTGVRLASAGPVPLGLLQVRDNHAGVEPAGQGLLGAAAPALQQVQHAGLVPDEPVREALPSRVLQLPERAFSELPARLDAYYG
jgi:hypothetical protein